VAAGTAVIAATAGRIAGKGAVTVKHLSDLRGTWSMTEAEGCVASGPLELTQDIAHLTGTYQPSGACRLPSGRSVDRFGPLHWNSLPVVGNTAGSQVHFQTGGVLTCDYQGTIEGEPASRVRGSMQCSEDVAGGDRLVVGTFTMTR
jgi:hypothetical protein